MRISFTCKTNHGYIMINTAKFILPNGTTLTVDRTRTTASAIIDGDFNMTWGCCYLWAINDNNIFPDIAYLTDSSAFEDLVAGAKVVFELEDDVEDEDYFVEAIDWAIGE